MFSGNICNETTSASAELTLSSLERHPVDARCAVVGLCLAVTTLAMMGTRVSLAQYCGFGLIPWDRFAHATAHPRHTVDTGRHVLLQCEVAAQSTSGVL